MMRAWNARLPAAMSIRSLEPVADDYSLHGYIEYNIYSTLFSRNAPCPGMLLMDGIITGLLI